MQVQAGHYTAMAGLVAYPDGEFRQRLAGCRELLGLKIGGATSAAFRSANGDVPLFPAQCAAHLADFDAATCGCELADLEELYTRTFDFSSPCALEIGWQLFGEDYHRGALLVRLREELARHGIQEACELPDHLIHVLPLLDRMRPDEAARFATACVTPAVEKIRANLQGKRNPYESIVRCLLLMLAAEYGSGTRGGEVLPTHEESPPGWPPRNPQEVAHESAGIS